MCTLNSYSWFVEASNNELKQMQVSGYSPFEEKLNWLSHGLGALLAIVALVAMVLVSESITAVVATSVYGASLILMFVSSTLYHASVSDKAKRVLKKLDHSAIYLLMSSTDHSSQSRTGSCHGSTLIIAPSWTRSVRAATQVRNWAGFGTMM